MTVDELAAELDRNHPGWWLTRTEMGEWLVQIKSDGITKTCCGPVLQQVLQQAAEFEFLPLVPLEPVIRDQRDFEILKNGTQWQLLYKRGFCTRFKTRKAAQEAIARWIGIDAQRHADWVAQHGWCKRKTEGVDFRWAS